MTRIRRATPGTTAGPSKAPGARATLGAALVGAAVLAVGCGPRPGEEPEELEVVEVDAGATAQMTPEGDATEPERGPSLAGSLPPSFPKDFPVPLPSSVAELSTSGDGPRFVVLRSAQQPAALRAELRSRLDRAGWRQEGGDPWSRTKDGRAVRVRLDADPVGGGTLLRVEY